jgi:hypothetical protein
VAETYNGAEVMAGEHNGQQKLICSRYKTALFLQCYRHQLNLELKQSVACMWECKAFFEILSGFTAQFRNYKRCDKFVTKCLLSVA